MNDPRDAAKAKILTREFSAPFGIEIEFRSSFVSSALQFPTTNLLQASSSVLDATDWTLLSNLIDTYDDAPILSIAQQFIDSNRILLDPEATNRALVREFFVKIYEASSRFICSNADLCQIFSANRSNFLRSAAESLSCLGIIFNWNRSHLCDSRSFVDIAVEEYGTNSMQMVQRVLKFVDPDVIIVKLTLSLFAFSNHTSILSSNSSLESLDTLSIYRIQNLYVELTWKYVQHKYGSYQAIQRLINLVQCLLTTTDIIFEAQTIEKHVNDIHALVEATELNLMLNQIESNTDGKP